MDKVITVSGEFGSGGRELGVKLAEKLDIPFYDKELISMAADDINIAEEAFQNYDEHIVIHDPLDRQYYHAFSDIYKVPDFRGPVQCHPQAGCSRSMCHCGTVCRHDSG